MLQPAVRAGTFVGGLCLAFATMFACSEGAATSSAPDASAIEEEEDEDAGATPDGGVNPGPGTNGCTTFVDRTAEDARRVIRWSTLLPTTAERCLKIRKGQAVTFSREKEDAGADFRMHPLMASGGDSPTPIPSGLVAATGQIEFPDAGTFGFACAKHPNVTGAILVVD